MTLLAYNELINLGGVITNVKDEHINSSSIDITLGRKLLIERPPGAEHDSHIVNLMERQPLEVYEWDLLINGPFVLQPGHFILAQSEQVFHLPENLSAEYKLKSSMARIGLEHLNAGWCDAGWNGSVLTLELKNMTRYHRIVLDHGVGIGQMVFFAHSAVPANRSYAARGRYNNDRTVSGIKE